jgi:hypothetical protein
MAKYDGHQGELWYARLCKPLAESPDERYLVMTTPYILTADYEQSKPLAEKTSGSRNEQL